MLGLLLSILLLQDSGPARHRLEQQVSRPPELQAHYDADSSSFTPPTWAERPRTVYPEAALAAELPGRATMACIVDAQGLARLCEVESEAPSGFGFGDALLATQAMLRFHPGAIDGSPVESVVAFSQIFEMSPTVKPSAKLAEALRVIGAVGRLNALCREYADPTETKRWDALSAEIDTETFNAHSAFEQVLARAYANAKDPDANRSMSREDCDRQIEAATTELVQSGAKETIGPLLRNEWPRP